jgi:RNA polymerase sigma factor (sigma-70 family)
MSSSPPLTAELLATHGEWLRRLAAHLLHDGPDADDVVQETWKAAVVSPPEPDRPVRPWLAQVLRNAIRSTGRASSRRTAREASAALRPESPATAEELLERMRLQEQIARLMTALEEPYRTTLLQRFYDGRDATEIGEACGVPAGTVRWRISEGIRRLRERLDEQQSGPQAWRAALLPIAAPRARAARPSGSPSLVPLALGAGAVAIVAGALLVARLRPAADRAERPALVAGGDRTAPARPVAPQAPSPPRATETREEAMRRENLKRAAAFLGVALPALVAGAGEKRDPVTEEGIDLCVATRERTLECKEEYADAIIAHYSPSPERQAALRRKVIEKITAEGSGPLEPRREKCAAMAMPGPPPPTEKAGLERMRKAIDECFAQPECTARVACLIKLYPLDGKPPAPATAPSRETGQRQRR